jgi:fibronectin type 3 domain-containing protein
MGSRHNHKRSFIITMTVVFLASCSGDSTPSDPSIPTLLAPANNEPCLDGSSVNDSQSSVNFSWTQATDAVTYDVEVEQLLLNTKSTYPATTNSLDVTLNKAVPYRWKVIANGEPDTTPSESDSWKFYLAGNGAVNYAPFPPELLTPRSASTISVADGVIPLSWTCSDIEGDITSFEVYLDTTDASSVATVVTYLGATTEIELEAEPGNTYYWKVIAIDADENKASSGVYSFITQ